MKKYKIYIDGTFYFEQKVEVADDVQLKEVVKQCKQKLKDIKDMKFTVESELIEEDE